MVQLINAKPTTVIAEESDISAVALAEGFDAGRLYVEWADPNVPNNTAGGYGYIYFKPTVFGASADCTVREFTVRSATNAATLPSVPVYAKIIDPDNSSKAMAVSQPVTMSNTSTDYTFVFDRSPTLTHTKQYILAFCSGAKDASPLVAIGVSLYVASSAQDIYYSSNTTWRPITKWKFSQEVIASAIRYNLGTPITIDSYETDATDPDNPITYAEVTLLDRTANVVEIEVAIDELRVTLPAAVDGKVRDFELNIAVGDGTAALIAPALVVSGAGAENIVLANPDGAMPEIADGTATMSVITLLYFSELAEGAFIIKGEQVQEITQ